MISRAQPAVSLYLRSCRWPHRRRRGHSPSASPLPSRALEGWQYHERSVILRRPSFSVTSVGVIAVRGPKKGAREVAEERKQENGTMGRVRSAGGAPEQLARFGGLVIPAPVIKTRSLTIGHVLLVGKHQEEAISHLSVVQDLVQLFARLVDPGAVLRVDDKDEALGAGVVVPPEGSDLVLAADVLRARGGRGLRFAGFSSSSWWWRREGAGMT